MCFFHLTNVLINFAQPHRPNPHHLSNGPFLAVIFVVFVT